MSNKIIVESINDKAIFQHILNTYCSPSESDIEAFERELGWIDLQGLERSKLILKLKDIKTDILKAPKMAKVGIIIDFDNEDLKSRLAFLNEICSEAFELDININSQNTLESFTFVEQDIDFELGYSFIGINGQGELEHLLRTIADCTTSHHADCLEQTWVSCLYSKGIVVKEKIIRKLWMDFYKRMDCLTADEQQQAAKNIKWENFLKLHPDKFDFSKDFKELNEIKEFLRHF